MIYANKKVNTKVNLAQQTAQVIATVQALMDKNLIRLSTDTVYLDLQLWKDKNTAANWINCLHLYYCLKRKFKPTLPLYFKNRATDELIGKIDGKKVKLYIFN
jgi:hypothetical protein